MYQINSGLPKTLVRSVLEFLSKNEFSEIKEVINAVLSQPISPELIPLHDHQVQSTEDSIGKYELHDFFLYHFLNFGASRQKLALLASVAFGGVYSNDEIAETLGTFWRRFRSNQFKRNSAPDGPKICSVSLSPRSDWRMPSDLSSDQ